MCEPGERSDDHAHPAERHGDERPHETRVELLARATGDLRACFGCCARLLVRPGRRDHVEHVGNCNDPSAQRDLLARDPAWVSLAVPPFVVVADGARPLAEPTSDRLDEQLAVERMQAELRPFRLGRAARLVQDLLADRELPDVVEQGRPVEEVQLVVRQVELLAEAVGSTRELVRHGRV